MSDHVTRELVAMVVRFAVMASMMGLFYFTTGFGGMDTPGTLAVAAAVAFGGQSAAFVVRRLMGDPRAKPAFSVAFAAFAIGATLFVLLR